MRLLVPCCLFFTLFNSFQRSCIVFMSFASLFACLYSIYFCSNSRKNRHTIMKWMCMLLKFKKTCLVMKMKCVTFHSFTGSLTRIPINFGQCRKSFAAIIISHYSTIKFSLHKSKKYHVHLTFLAFGSL